MYIKYFNTYYKRRAKKGIKIRSIHPKTLLAQQHMKTNKMVLSEAKLVDSSEFKITPVIQVYDNKVNIVSWKEKVGLIIESKEISEAVKSIFQLCWMGQNNNFNNYL